MFENSDIKHLQIQESMSTFRMHMVWNDKHSICMQIHDDNCMHLYLRHVYLLIFLVVHCQGVIKSTRGHHENTGSMSFGYVPEPSTSLRFTGFGATWQFGCPRWQKHRGGSIAFNPVSQACWGVAFKFIGPPTLYSIHSKLTSCKVCCLSALVTLVKPEWLQESVDSPKLAAPR